MAISRLFQVIHLGAWRQIDGGLAWANAVHAQVEAIQKDAVVLQRILANDARDVGVGQHWGREFRELWSAAVLVEASVDADVELRIEVGLLHAGADAANSQRLLPLATLRILDSEGTACSPELIMKLIAHDVGGAPGVDNKRASRLLRPSLHCEANVDWVCPAVGAVAGLRHLSKCA